ncbi:hypothetical protein BD769DRAFT_1397381 [Suillus cothurnatus]|nr:hypothetical protein BD769DRAFT_1397381 [Suillus cothurnatus]
MECIAPMRYWISCLLQDATESQQRYIDTARNGITQIYNTLLSGGPRKISDLVLLPSAIILLKNTASSSRNTLSRGDEPDAQSDALAAAYNADWRAEARKIVVLITDSPPHRIGEDGDAFPKGNWPALCCDEHRKSWHTLYVVACEPTLSENYRVNYCGRGRVINLGDLSVLPTLIAGSILEAANSEISLRLPYENSAAAGGPEARASTLATLYFVNVCHTEICGKVDVHYKMGSGHFLVSADSAKHPEALSLWIKYLED